MRGPAVTHPGPRTSALAYWVGRCWFRLFGWDVEGDAPQVERSVVIAAPHTTNWDLPHMLAASFLFRFRVSWLGKHTLFRAPFGTFFRLLGGVAVDRRAPGGLVAQAAVRLAEADKLALAVPPSGTRGRSDFWKSGFYWIAHTANVPIVCGYLDYSRRRAGLGLTLTTTGDVAADMARIRDFYAGIEGKFPALQTPIRLRDEQQSSEDADDTRPAQDESSSQVGSRQGPRQIDGDGS